MKTVRSQRPLLQFGFRMPVEARGNIRRDDGDPKLIVFIAICTVWTSNQTEIKEMKRVKRSTRGKNREFSSLLFCIVVSVHFGLWLYSMNLKNNLSIANLSKKRILPDYTRETGYYMKELLYHTTCISAQQWITFHEPNVLSINMQTNKKDSLKSMVTYQLLSRNVSKRTRDTRMPSAHVNNDNVIVILTILYKLNKRH